MTDLDVDAAISELLEMGDIELVGVQPDGEVVYRLTPQGEARVKVLLGEEQ